MIASRTCRPVTPQDVSFHELAQEARSEGHHFIDRLLGQWADGSNRFDQTGECLLGRFENELLVAVGGLNRDPYTRNQGTGRIRHLYVRLLWRRTGFATELMRELLLRGGPVFERIHLRTDNPAAIRLYAALDFSPTNKRHATHVWLSPKCEGR